MHTHQQGKGTMARKATPAGIVATAVFVATITMFTITLVIYWP
jgi:hypothetical protein